MVDPDPDAVAAGSSACSTPALRRRLVAGGLETVREYAWPRRIEQLERFFERVADERPQFTGALPGPRVDQAG